MALRRGNGGGEVSLPPITSPTTSSSLTPRPRIAARVEQQTPRMPSSHRRRRERCCTFPRQEAVSPTALYRHLIRPRPGTGHDPAISPQSAREVLAGVLANDGADLVCARDAVQSTGPCRGFTVLAVEYETLAARPGARWGALLEHSGLDPVQLEQVRRSEARGPLLAAIRDAEARGLAVEGVFPKLVALRSLDDAETLLPSCTLGWSVGHRQPGRSAERVPASSPDHPESARRHRSRHGPRPRGASCCHGTPGERARRARPRASRDLGTPARRPPVDQARHERWLVAVSTVAAYREHWNIADDRRPLGPGAPLGRSKHLVTDGVPNSPSQRRSAVERWPRTSPSSVECRVHRTGTRGSGRHRAVKQTRDIVTPSDNPEKTG